MTAACHVQGNSAASAEQVWYTGCARPLLVPDPCFSRAVMQYIRAVEVRGVVSSDYYMGCRAKISSSGTRVSPDAALNAKNLE